MEQVAEKWRMDKTWSPVRHCARGLPTVSASHLIVRVNLPSMSTCVVAKHMWACAMTVSPRWSLQEMSESERDARVAQWKRAVQRSFDWVTPDEAEAGSDSDGASSSAAARKRPARTSAGSAPAPDVAKAA
jgi:hypothetical protein